MSELTATLYNTDFATWTQEQAAHLRAKRITKLDYDHLAEEIEGLSKRDRRELERRLRNLMLHGLKWAYQSQERARRGRSWQTSMHNARDGIEQLLRDNPSLSHQLDAAMAWAYPRARRMAATQTGLPITTFPALQDWTFDQLMNEALWR